MAWSDTKRETVIAEYQDIMANEYDTDAKREAATVEVVKELAEKYEETVNGVRNVLNRAGVYIKKAAAGSTKAGATSTKRVSKADALQELKNTIAAIDPSLVNEDLIDKMTGVTAAYITSILVVAVKD